MPIKSEVRQDIPTGRAASSCRFAAKFLWRGGVGFGIALVAGANAYGAAVALAWGAIIFGAGMTVMYLLITAVAALLQRGAGGAAEPRTPGRSSKLLDFVFGSWRGEVFFFAILVLAALEEPTLAAFIAGYPVGLALITIPVFFGVARLFRLKRTTT